MVIFHMYVSQLKFVIPRNPMFSGVPTWCEAGVIYCQSGVIRLCIGVLEAWDCVLPLLSHLTDAGQRRRNGGFLPFQSVQSVQSVKIRENEK